MRFLGFLTRRIVGIAAVMVGVSIITFAISQGKEKASVNAVGAAAAEALAQAVLRAVRAAKTLGGLPGLAG